MPPKDKKERTTNFRSFETQSRLLAALVASLDNHRFDYKKIAKLYGGTATESSMEHRFRVLKCQAEFLRALVKKGVDPEPYQVYEIKNKEEIQKYFGASTPDGIGFQFRSINKAANTLKAAVAKGEDPVEAFAQLKGGPGLVGSVPNTPSHSRATPASSKRARPTKATPGSGSAATPASKRRKAIKIEPISDPDLDDDDVDSSDLDFSGLDVSPSKLKPKVLSTPKKNPGSLLPHSAWAKPVPKTENEDNMPAPRPRHVAIAPAPTAPLPNPYTLAPIAGLAASSSTPAVPNGYTNPATGLAYNYVAAGPLSSSVTPSGTNSPAPVTLPTRRGSAFSTSSFTLAGSSPITPTPGFADPALPAPANGNTTGVHSTANANFTTGMSPPIVISSSPSPSITATAPAPAPAPQPRQQPPQQQPQQREQQQQQPASTGITFVMDELFTPFPPSSKSSSNNNNNNNTNHYTHNAREARFAAEMDFGGFDDEDEEDMGDI